MKRKAIVLLAPYADGAERRLGGIYAGLRKSDPDVYLILPGRCREELINAKILEVNDRKVHVLRPLLSGSRFPGGIGLHSPLRQGQSCWYFWQLVVTLRKLRIEAIYFPCSQPYLFLIRPLLWFVRLQLIVSFCMADVQLTLRHAQVCWLLDRCQHIDALSPQIEEELTKASRWAGKITTSPSTFFDPTRFKPEYPKKAWIVFAGRFSEDKQPLLAVQGMAHVVARRPEAHLFVCGRGALQAELVAAVKRLNLDRQVTIGHLSSPAEKLRRSAVFLSLQLYNNYPSQSLLEAMAAGNAIVATDVGETRLLVTEENGVLVPPEPAAVGQAILQLLDDPHLHRKAEVSRARALRHTGAEYLNYIKGLFAKVQAL